MTSGGLEDGPAKTGPPFPFLALRLWGCVGQPQDGPCTHSWPLHTGGLEKTGGRRQLQALHPAAPVWEPVQGAFVGPSLCGRRLFLRRVLRGVAGLLTVVFCDEWYTGCCLCWSDPLLAGPPHHPHLSHQQTGKLRSRLPEVSCSPVAWAATPTLGPLASSSLGKNGRQRLPRRRAPGPSGLGPHLLTPSVPPSPGHHCTGPRPLAAGPGVGSTFHLPAVTWTLAPQALGPPSHGRGACEAPPLACALPPASSCHLVLEFILPHLPVSPCPVPGVPSFFGGSLPMHLHFHGSHDGPEHRLSQSPWGRATCAPLSRWAALGRAVVTSGASPHPHCGQSCMATVTRVLSF